MRAIDEYFLKKEEPVRSCLEALRGLVLQHDAGIAEAWKYGMPFYLYRDKMFCYLWTDKKTSAPYLGIVEGRKLDHPMLELDKRARMKILRIDPLKDLPTGMISEILNAAMALY